MINREKFELFFGDSSSYYLDKLEKYDKGNKISFNLPAFLFGILWLLYRKLYVQSFILFSIMVLFSILENIFFENYNSNPENIKTITIIQTLLFAFLTGFLGDLVYLNHAKKKMVQLSIKYSDNENDLKLNLIKSGGTSIKNIIIAIAIYIILLVYLNLVSSNN